MNVDVQNLIESNLKKFETKEIDWTSMSKVLVEAVDQCEDFDDVASLIRYCIQDETGVGLNTAKEIADKSAGLRNVGHIHAMSRNGVPSSKTVEYLTLSNSFAKYSCAQDKTYYLKFFEVARNSASSAMDYDFLAGGLWDARSNMNDESIDPEYKVTKALILKAGELCVDEHNARVMEGLLYLAKNKINDKELTKSLTSLKKKLK